MAGELVDPHIFQILILLINGSGGIALLLFGFILKGSKEAQLQMSLSIEKVSDNLSALNTLILQHYVTSDEFDRLESYCRKEIHKSRDELQYHEVALNLLARHPHVGMEMPPRHPALT